MRINHGKIKRRQEEIRVGERNEHSPVDRGNALENFIGGLERVSLILACYRKRRVSQVELRDPGGELRLASCGRRNVAVVWADGLSRVVP